MLGLSLSSIGQLEGAAPHLWAKYIALRTYCGFGFTLEAPEFHTTWAGEGMIAPSKVKGLITLHCSLLFGIHTGLGTFGLGRSNRVCSVFTCGVRIARNPLTRSRLHFKVCCERWEIASFPGLEAPFKGALGRKSRRARAVTGKAGKGLWWGLPSSTTSVPRRSLHFKTDTVFTSVSRSTPKAGIALTRDSCPVIHSVISWTVNAGTSHNCCEVVIPQ